MAAALRSFIGCCSVAVALVGLVAVSGCSGSGEPTEFSDRASLPNCGAVDSRDALTDDEQAAITCLTDAHASAQPAELVVNLNGTEGEHLVRYVRVLEDGSAEVFFDHHRDPLSSADWTYQGNCREVETSPFEVVAPKSCDPAVALD